MKLKRTMAVVLALVLMTLPSALAGAEPVYFEPVLTNALELSVEDWTDASEGRSLVSVLLILDLALELNDDNIFDSSQNSYVAVDGDVIDLYIHGNNGRDYLIAYQPALSVAAYQRREYSDDGIIYLALVSSCDEVHRNNKQEMASIAGDLSSAWGGNEG